MKYARLQPSLSSCVIFLLASCLVGSSTAPSVVLCVEADGGNHVERRGSHSCPDEETPEETLLTALDRAAGDAECSDCWDVPLWAGAACAGGRTKLESHDGMNGSAAVTLNDGSPCCGPRIARARSSNPSVFGASFSSARSSELRC